MKLKKIILNVQRYKSYRTTIVQLKTIVTTKSFTMKKGLFVIAVAGFCIAGLASCKAGMGCKGNGRNVGAERLLTGDKKTMKEVKRAGKFRGSKM